MLRDGFYASQVRAGGGFGSSPPVDDGELEPTLGVSR
jgi:hypothetical protein